MRIRLIGQRNNLGIGIHYSNFADHLRQIHGLTVEEVDTTNQASVDRAIQESSDSDVNICFLAANIHKFFRGKIIQYVVFETDRIADHILQVIHPADAVWVPSHWGRRVLEAHGIDPNKIAVVPEGVNPYQFNPYRSSQSGRFRFLTIGKYEERKGIKDTIRSFAEEFGNDSSVELYVKTGYYKDDPERLEDLKQFANSFGLTNLLIYWGAMSEADVVELYRSSNVFVFPTRGEGWGLPLIEAAASGLPIITTMYSGHTEFLESIQSSVIQLRYDIVPVDCPDFKIVYPGDCGQWAKPDYDHLRQSMRGVYTNYQVFKDRAVENSRVIRTKFNWQQSIDLALKNVAKIQHF